MGLHILVGLVGLAAQPLSLRQRGRMRLLAALAAVLVVVQLLVRCRLLLPASRDNSAPLSYALPQSQTLQQLCQSSSLLAALGASLEAARPLPCCDGLRMHRQYCV